MEIILNLHPEKLNLYESLPILPEWRREKTMLYRREEDKLSSVAAWLLLREACQRYLFTNEVPSMSFSESGKPFLTDYPNFFFNLSHTDGAATCVVSSESEVGIDIECVRPIDFEVMQQVMNAEEQNHILSSSQHEVEFARLWTRKESLLKCTGKGLTAIQLLPALLQQTESFRFESYVTSDNRFVYSACQSLD